MAALAVGLSFILARMPLPSQEIRTFDQVYHWKTSVNLRDINDLFASICPSGYLANPQSDRHILRLRTAD